MRRVLVVGCGKRVLEAALPAFARAAESFEVAGIRARTEKTVVSEGRPHRVLPLTSLDAAALAGIDLVYVAVGKPSVPSVLTELARHDVSRAHLLVETPVLLLRHFRHVKLFKAFRSASVSEDCCELPWFDTLRAAAPALGDVKSVTWRHSAYAYHGMAMSKSVLGARRVRQGRVATAGGSRERHLTFDNGTRAVVVEPRDYARGGFRIEGARGVLADRPGEAGSLVLTPILEGGSVAGFRAGDFETRLDDAERSLAPAGDASAGVVARMDALKRVGFLRLLRRLARGLPAYALEDGLDDMVVDHALERFGLWMSTPLTSPRSIAGNTLFHLLSSLSRR
jgi:hypothetical protein